MVKINLSLLKFIAFLSLGISLEVDALDPYNYSIKTLPDGSQIFQDAEGSIVLIKPNGERVIKKNNGTIIDINPDGSQTINIPGGGMIKIMADGTKLIKKPNGEMFEIKPNQP